MAWEASLFQPWLIQHPAPLPPLLLTVPFYLQRPRTGDARGRAQAREGSMCVAAVG